MTAPSAGPAARTLARMLRAPLDDLRAYDGRRLRRDALAGLNVAVLAVPQSLAYAVIAGVPPEVGLYTLVVQGALGALFSSQPMLSSGPINTQSLLVAAIATRVHQASVPAPGVDPAAFYLQLVVALTLLKGVLQMALAAGGLAALVRYVSASVILGFTAGAGILIAVGQIAPFLGIETPESLGAPGLQGPLAALAPRLGEASVPALAVGLGSLTVIVVARRASRRLPGPLLAVLLGGAAAAALGLPPSELPRVDSVPRQLPSLQLPGVSLAQAEALLGGAFALAVVGLMESWAVGKTISARTGQPLSSGQELFAQGLSNAASSFLGCIPGSASFSRSMLNYHSGAATRFAGLWNAAFAAAVLLVFGPLAAFVPKASLAAVLFLIAWELVDWRGLLRMARVSRTDALVGLVTLAATLTVPLAYAVFAGVLLNIGLYLRRASRLHVAEMVSETDDPGSGPFVERPLVAGARGRPVVFLQLQGDLFFGQADELAERLAALSHERVRVVIIRLKRTLSLDATVLATLEQFARAHVGRGGDLILCGVLPEVALVLRRYGIVDQIGEENFFEATPGVFASAKRALARAKQITQEEIDPDAWSEDWADDPDD